ncbi:MAG: VWA domain-containing protein [Candidatus Sulfotelmatobacter sp.]
MLTFDLGSVLEWSCRRWFLLLILSGVPFLHSQTSVPDSSSTVPRFQSKVSVVLVDVVVTDNKDAPVTGLEQKDFEILEDGKPQTITGFEEHKVIHTKPPKLPPMPPDVYTNFPPVRTTDSVNILLLDALNTQVADQSYVRAQLIRYLTTVQPGTRLAVFVLTSRLRMIQEVTTDSSLLLAALNKQDVGGSPQQSAMLLSRQEMDMDAARTTELMGNLVGETDLALSAMAPRAVAYMMQSKLDSRVETTLQALQQLARYLGGIPGRKNLLWFSGSFPISVFPDLNAAEPFQAVRQYGGEVQRTATLLTVAQVAIYPIAAEGLVSDSGYEASATRIGEARLSINQGPLDTGERNADHLSMEVLAENTGGKAFYDTNGLKDAMARAIDYGSHYYTLAYTPTDKKMDGRYRRIQLKLSAGKYKVAYRRGYYADTAKDVKAKQEQPGDPLLPLMKRGLPDFSQILFKARVTPSNPQPPPDAARIGDNVDLKGPCTRYGVDFAIAVDDLAFETASDGLRGAAVEVMLIAYDRDGKPLNSVVRQRELGLKPQSFAAAQAAGLQLHFDIDVPTDTLAKNNAYLRIGIYDARASNAGTLEVPLHPIAAPAALAK